jgi:hypothetical protein
VAAGVAEKANGAAATGRAVESMSKEEWSKLSRAEKLASVLYPNQVSEERRKQMAEFAKAEGKRAPQDVQNKYVSPYQKGKWR